MLITSSASTTTRSRTAVHTRSEQELLQVLCGPHPSGTGYKREGEMASDEGAGAEGQDAPATAKAPRHREGRTEAEVAENYANQYLWTSAASVAVAAHKAAGVWSEPLSLPGAFKRPGSQRDGAVKRRALHVAGGMREAYASHLAQPEGEARAPEQTPCRQASQRLASCGSESALSFLCSSWHRR